MRGRRLRAPAIDPLVSVLIPCYNAERTIAEAVRSALAQTHRPLEVIVVDDGSTDHSTDVLRGLDAPELRWTSGPNRGGPAARNAALAMAAGDFVQFLDADDLLLAEKVERQLAAFDPECDVVLSDFRVEAEGGAGPAHIVRQPALGPDLVAEVIRHSVATPTPLHRRRHVVAVGGWEEGLACCQEYELHVRSAMNAWRVVRHVPEVLSVARRQAGSVSANEGRVYLTMVALVRRWIAQLTAMGELGSARRAALSEVAYTCGRRLTRLARTREAREAFGLSLDVSEDGRLPLRGAMGVLTRMLGPVWAERVRSLLRRS